MRSLSPAVLFPGNTKAGGTTAPAQRPFLPPVPPSTYEHTGDRPSLPQSHISLCSAHPVSLPRGGVGGAAPGLCRVPRRGRAGAARARGAGCCWPRELLLQFCAGGWIRRSCCARGGLLASASAGLLRPPKPGSARFAGCKPGMGASCSWNRLYTLAAAAAGWLPPGRRSRFASLPAGSYLPTGTL